MNLAKSFAFGEALVRVTATANAWGVRVTDNPAWAGASAMGRLVEALGKEN